MPARTITLTENTTDALFAAYRHYYSIAVSDNPSFARSDSIAYQEARSYYRSVAKRVTGIKHERMLERLDTCMFDNCDSLDNRYTLVRILTHLGYKVVTA